MKVIGSKYVWVLRGDLESKHQGLESKIPQNHLNIKFIFDNREMIKGWTFGRGLIGKVKNLNKEIEE